MALELGSVDALDAWQKRGPHRTRAIASKTIYHVLAGNLAVSGMQSLVCGLILGARNFVKVPSGNHSPLSPLQKEAAFTRPVSEVEVQLRRFVAALPAPLRQLVTLSHEFDPAAFSRAEAVIVYGTDETVAKLRAQARWDQIFLGYGLQVSLLWLGKLKRWTPRQLQAIAHDICIYDQMGCLSPQAIYLERGSATKSFCAALADAMQCEIARLPEPVRTPAELGRIAESLDLARALGQPVWPVGGEFDAVAGAVILDKNPAFQFSCLHRTVTVHEVTPRQIPRALALVKGKISTLGVLGKLPSGLRESLIDLGVKRFCPEGRMQHPPLIWHHDGAPAISGLVRWADDELL